MQEKNVPNLENVLEEHTRKVYELYQNKSSSFQKTFRLLFSFALLFLFIIVIPFVTIKVISQKVDKRQAQLGQEIGHRKNLQESYLKIKNGIDNLRINLARGPDELIAFIRELNQRQREIQNGLNSNSLVQSPIQQMQGPVSTIQDKNQIVQDEVNQRFAEYQSIIEQEIIEPLRNLNNDTLVIIDSETTIKGLDTLKKTLASKLAENPRFWETIPGKESHYSGLEKEVDHFWRIHGAAIESQRLKLNNEIDILEKENTTVKNQIVMLENQSKQLDERLQQIEFPFGKLPVGLTESIAVFPIILAIGFLVIASQLREAIQLRKSFHQLYQRKDPTRRILDDQQIALIAPLWIDPESTSKQKLVRFTILTIPFLIFLISCILIFYNWTIPGFFAYADRLNWWLYGGLYLLSLGIFIYGYRQIFIELSGYSNNGMRI